MSDPTTPPGDNDHIDEQPTESTPEVDSEPIDVNELLESTRKLFEPEELQRSMEQAGYIPEPAAETSDESDNDAEEAAEGASTDDPELVESEPNTTSGDEEPGDEETVEAEDTPVEPETDSIASGENTVDELADVAVALEEPQLRGVNVLSIVAFVLALALSPLAVIFGYIALGQARRARQRGETLALWAIGLGWIVFAAWVVLIASLAWIGYQQGITVDSLREFIDLFGLP